MTKEKLLLTPKIAEEIQNDIFRKMNFQNKMKMFFEVNNRVFKIAVDKIKLKYPNLDQISFSKKLYNHIDLKRKTYDDLFERFLKKELKHV